MTTCASGGRWTHERATTRRSGRTPALDTVGPDDLVDVAPVSDGLYGPQLEEFIPNRSDRLKLGCGRERGAICRTLRTVTTGRLDG